MTSDETKPVEELVPQIMKQYSQKPRGWRVLSTPRGDMLIRGPSTAFQLKLISLGPNKFTGAGLEIPNPDRNLPPAESIPEFGLRPITETDMSDILESLRDPERSRTSLESILKRSPIAPPDLEKTKAEHLLSGPVLRRPNFESMDNSISKVQSRLEKQARKTFEKRYPRRAGMYF
ncbi:MAG: hypothetical protein GF309_07075 [Candidatus Lokiarchaeota archaeon]|nr:hypothetical protein [Candidatus Lokiarchaeota archaeon]